MAPLMLSVSGCRGIVGESLTPDVATRFAASLASVLPRGAHVVLARDGRRGGEMLHAAATAGLLASGIHVVDIGIAMTPTTAVMVDEVARATQQTTAGLILTASHNPQQWNGLKALIREPVGRFDSGACAPRADLATRVIDRFHAAVQPSTPWNELGTRTTRDGASDVHATRVLRALEAAGLATIAHTIAKGVKVAVDCVNASSSITAPLFLRSLGCDVVALNTNLTGPSAGLFPHPPEPTRENLSGAGGLSDVVRREACAVGFALDPDADRLALIDETGHYIGEEYTLALSAWAVLAGASHDIRPPHDLVVTNLSTSRMLEDVCARFGARVLRTPVGEAHVVEAMKHEHAILGGEGNGGTIWPRSCYVRDSLSAMALTLWLMQREKKSLSQLVASLPRYAIEKRKVDLARKADAEPAIRALATANASHKVDLQDGVRIDFTHGPHAGNAWLHVRASNTEPIMRLIAEAPTRDAATQILEAAGKTIATR